MRSMKKLPTPSFINVHQLVLQHEEVPEVMAVHSIEWMLQGILTSLLSGVGFYIITRALEYAKKYCQKERQKQNVFQKYFTEDENFHWRNFRVQGTSLVDDRFYNRAPNLFAAYKRSPGFLCHNNVAGNESTSATSVNANGRPPQWSDLDLTDFRNLAPFSSMLNLAEQTSHRREINEGTEVGLKKDSFCSSPSNVKIWSISDSYHVDSSRESSSSNSAHHCELGANFCHGICNQKKEEPHSTVTKKFDEKTPASGRRARKASKTAHLPITKRNQVASKISECEVRVIKSKVMRSVYDVESSETDPSLSSGAERIYNAFDSVIQEVKQTSSVTISSAAGTTKQHFVEHCQDENAVCLVTDKSQRELNYFQSWATWFATPQESQLCVDHSKSALEMSQFSEVCGERQFNILEDWQSSVDGLDKDLEIGEQRKEETDSLKSVRPVTMTDTRLANKKISPISEQFTSVKPLERTPVKTSNQTQDFDNTIVQEKLFPALTCSFISGSISGTNSAHMHTSGSPEATNAEKQTASSTSLKKPEKEHSPAAIKMSPSLTQGTKAVSKAKCITSASPLHKKPPKLQDRSKDEANPETLAAVSRKKRADKTRKLDRSVSCSPTTSEKSTMCRPPSRDEASGKEPDTKDQLTEICSLMFLNDTSKCFGSTDIYQLEPLSNESDMIDVNIPNQDVDRTKSLSSNLIYVLSKTNQRVPSFKTQKHKNLSKLKRAASKKNFKKQITKDDKALDFTRKASKEVASKRDIKAGSTKTTEIVAKSGDQEGGQPKRTALKTEGSSIFKKQKNLKKGNSLRHKQIDSLEGHLLAKSEKEVPIPFQSEVKQCQETVLQKCNRRIKVHPLKSVDKYRTKRQSFLNKEKLSDNTKPLAHTATIEAEAVHLKDNCVESPVDEIDPLITKQTKSHGVDSKVVESTSTQRDFSLKFYEPNYLDFNGTTLAEAAQFFLNTSESSVDPETKLGERSSLVHLFQTNGAIDSSVYSPSNPLDPKLSARLSPESGNAASSKLSAPPSTTHACKSVDKKILEPNISKTSSSAEKINKKDILKNKNILSKEMQQIRGPTEKSNASKQAKELLMGTSKSKKRIQEPCLLKSKSRLEPAEKMLLKNENHNVLKPIETKCAIAETNAQTVGQETPKSCSIRPSKNKPQVRREARPSPKTTMPLKQNEKSDIKRKAAVPKKSTAESPQVASNTLKERFIAKKDKPLGVKKKNMPLLPLALAQPSPEVQVKHQTVISTERNASSNGVANRSALSASQACSSKVPPRPVKATVHSDESAMTIRSYDLDSDRSLRSRPMNADKQRRVVLKKSALDEIVKRMQSP